MPLLREHIVIWTIAKCLCNPVWSDLLCFSNQRTIAQTNDKQLTNALLLWRPNHQFFLVAETNKQTNCGCLQAALQAHHPSRKVWKGPMGRSTCSRGVCSCQLAPLLQGTAGDGTLCGSTSMPVSSLWDSFWVWPASWLEYHCTTRSKPTSRRIGASAYLCLC